MGRLSYLLNPRYGFPGEIFKHSYTGLAIILPCFVAACGDTSGRATDAPQVAASLLPAELPTGSGNFLVCLPGRVGREELVDVTVPERVVFQSWEELQKPLLSDDPFSRTIDPITEKAKELTQYAVITTEPFALGPDRRCARVAVRALKTHTRMWTHEVVPAAKKLLFQAEDIEVSKGFKLVVRKKDPVQSTVQDMIDSGILNGVLLDDATDAVVLDTRW